MPRTIGEKLDELHNRELNAYLSQEPEGKVCPLCKGAKMRTKNGYTHFCNRCNGTGFVPEMGDVEEADERK